MTRWYLSGVIALLMALATATQPAEAAPPATQPAASSSIHNILGAFGNELRGQDGHVKIDEMVALLKELGVNTCLWHIWNAPTDWDDLKLFLPKAAQAGLDVWVVIGPATKDSPDGKESSEPFKGDYGRWAEEIAKLSLTYPNLKAWAMDRFSARYGTALTPDAAREIQTKAKSINPRLSFFVVMGFGDMATWTGSITPPFMAAFHDVIDGVIGKNPRHRDDIDEYWSALNDGPVALPNEIRFPWEVQSKVGDFVMASRKLKVVAGGRHVIRFRERDTFTGPTAGYHFKQLLVDGEVVWDEDVAGGSADWADVEVDVAKQAAGKSELTVAFRMIEKMGVGKFTVRWRVSDLRAEGFDPELGQGWDVTRQGAFETGFGGMPEPGKRRFHLPLIIVTGVESVEIPLQARRDGKCEGVVINSLPKDLKSAFNDEVRKSFREPGGKK